MNVCQKGSLLAFCSIFCLLFILFQDSCLLAADIRNMNILGIKPGDDMQQALQSIEERYPDANFRSKYEVLSIQGKQQKVAVSRGASTRQKTTDGATVSIVVMLSADLADPGKVQAIFLLVTYLQKEEYPLYQDVEKLYVQRYGEPTTKFADYNSRDQEKSGTFVWTEKENQVTRKNLTEYLEFCYEIISGDIYKKENTTCNTTQESTHAPYLETTTLVCGVIRPKGEPASNPPVVSTLACNLVDAHRVRQSCLQINAKRP